MSDITTLRRPRRTISETVRLRCLPCEVAWSGEAESPCWCCGAEGTPLNTAVAARERTVSAFDLDLLF